MFSTSRRKCSAVACRAAPAWFAAELLSNVFASVPLVMVILPFFVLRSFSDSMRSISGRIAVPFRGHAVAPREANGDVLVSAPGRPKQHRRRRSASAALNASCNFRTNCHFIFVSHQVRNGSSIPDTTLTAEKGAACSRAPVFGRELKFIPGAFGLKLGLQTGVQYTTSGEYSRVRA